MQADYSYSSVQSRELPNQMFIPQNQVNYNQQIIRQQVIQQPQQFIQKQIIQQQQTTQSIPHVHKYQVNQTRVNSQVPVPHIHQYDYQKTLQTQQTVPHIHQYDHQVAAQAQVMQQKQIILPAQNFNQASSEQQIVHRTQVSTDYSNPIMRETYQIDRELQVISVEDVEEPWKRKCVELEVRIYDLETELSRFKNMNLTDSVYVDDNRISELEAKNFKLIQNESQLGEDIRRMNEELDDWRRRYQKIQKEFQDSLGDTEQLRQLKATISDREVLITRLEQEMTKKDKGNGELNNIIRKQNEDLDEMKQQLYDMEQEMSQFSESQQQVTYMTSELETWKKKFRDLNSEFHHTQEQLMLTQAELDSLRNQKVIITTETRKSTHQNRTNINQM